MSRTPTPQQQAAIDAILNPAVRELKLLACAGAGKTSTLEMMAKACVIPSLYLCFNKSNADEAKGRFPKHVDCRTGHSAAFVWGQGKKMSHKLNRPAGAYVNVAFTGSEIARYFKIVDYRYINDDPNAVIGANYIGLLARITLARFEQSADESIALHHAPKADLEHRFSHVPYVVEPLRKLALKYAKKLWEGRIDTKSPVMITPDTYLKMYQLSKPVFNGFDVLYVDEYQDTTPCMHDIVQNQKQRMKIVAVGDARQAIYNWRGAVNALNMMKCETRMLTKSFRYGPAVADVATSVLQGAMKIEGFDKIESVVGRYDAIDTTRPYTCLYRTNGALLMDALTAIEQGKRVAIEIDTRDFVKLLESAQALFKRDSKNVKHDKIIPYMNWNDLLNEAKEDVELGRISRMVKDGSVERVIRVLQNFKSATDPEVTFTTAHKSKGREWKQVWVMEDFKSGYNEQGEWVGLTEEEQNLLYVACTRAQERLQYNAVASEYINRWQADSSLTQLEDEEQCLEIERMGVEKCALKAMMGDITAQIKRECSESREFPRLRDRPSGQATMRPPAIALTNSV